MKIALRILCIAAVPLTWTATMNPNQDPDTIPAPSPFGAFSVSLTVSDLEASIEFYAKLGFRTAEGFGGDHWRILRCGDVTIGLFEKLFDTNILTFNPGWNTRSEPLEDFTDVRELEQRFRAAGIEPIQAIDPEAGESGPASFVLVDPDGNPILFDQHVD